MASSLHRQRTGPEHRAPRTEPAQADDLMIRLHRGGTSLPVSARRGSASYRDGMARFVDAQLCTPGQTDSGERTPALIADRLTELHTLGLEVRDGGVDVVTLQVELVPARPVGRVYRQLGGWQGENQPALTGVNGVETEDVAEEGADVVRLLAVDDGVSAGDHFCSSWRHSALHGRSAAWRTVAGALAPRRSER